MLKIKNNIDLDELQKYGFEKYNMTQIDDEGRVDITHEYVHQEGEDDSYNIVVDERKILHINTSAKNNTVEDVLYDLIENKIVEKEVEKC